MNSKGGVPPKSKCNSASPPSWMSTSETVPLLMRTDGRGWIILVSSCLARQLSVLALSLRDLTMNAPGRSARRRNVVADVVAFRSVPSKV